MKPIFKHIIEKDLNPVNSYELAKELIAYRDFFFFLTEKLFFAEDISNNSRYINLHGLLPIKRRIIRANQLILKFIKNKNSYLSFNIKHQNNYLLNDKRTIAFALYQIYLAVDSVTTLINPNDIHSLKSLEIFQTYIYLNELISIINHEFVLKFKIHLLEM